MGIEGPCAPVVGDGYSGVFRDNRRARTRYRVLVPRSGARRLQERPDRPRDLGRDASVFLIAPRTPPDVMTTAGSSRAEPVARWSVTIGVGD